MPHFDAAFWPIFGNSHYHHMSQMSHADVTICDAHVTRQINC